jgi:CheY-like chemotaxis protein
VLLNLVTNAIKFTERGAVTVIARPAPAADTRPLLRFEVSDTGPGIPAEVLSQLFEPFVQADSSTARVHGGSGLGLAICKRLVEAMGGSIGASSEPGAGSCFFFELPLVRGSAEALQSEAKNPAPSVPRRLVFAGNGEEAVRLARDGDFDLVLMDVQMPVMDGVEATRRIRALDGPASGLPIVGLTANVMARERDGYLQAGMDECLTKPIDWRELSAVISRRALLPDSGSALVDPHAFDALAGVTGQARMQELVREGFDAYRLYHAEMLLADPAGLASNAHKISGSAGTLGLRGIAVAAARIEAAVKEGGDAATLLAGLERALATTREELLQRGILHAEGRTA